MDPIINWLGTLPMANALVPGKVKIVGKNGQLKVRDENLDDHLFSPTDLIIKWNEEVRVRVPDNWGWILSKLERRPPGVVVNSAWWEWNQRIGRMVASGQIYHWSPETQGCTCPAFQRATAHSELLATMGFTPWCKHLSLLTPLAPHFTTPLPLEETSGYVEFKPGVDFHAVNGRYVHSIIEMHIGDSNWSFPQTPQGHCDLFSKLSLAHGKGYQIRLRLFE